MAEGRKIPVAYWDSCVLIDYLSGVPDDHPITLMRNALLGKPPRVRIVTSVLTIAEVSMSAEEKNTGELDPTIRKKIDDLWNVTSPIELIETYPELCMGAMQLNRKLKQKGNSPLAGADALHVASALIVPNGIDEFHTNNGKVKKLKDRVGEFVTFEICDVRDISVQDDSGSEPADQSADSNLFGDVIGDARQTEET